MTVFLAWFSFGSTGVRRFFSISLASSSSVLNWCVLLSSVKPTSRSETIEVVGWKRSQWESYKSYNWINGASERRLCLLPYKIDSKLRLVQNSQRNTKENPSRIAIPTMCEVLEKTKRWLKKKMSHIPIWRTWNKWACGVPICDSTTHTYLAETKNANEIRVNSVNPQEHT